MPRLLLYTTRKLLEGKKWELILRRISIYLISGNLYGWWDGCRRRAKDVITWWLFGGLCLCNEGEHQKGYGELTPLLPLTSTKFTSKTKVVSISAIFWMAETALGIHLLWRLPQAGPEDYTYTWGSANLPLLSSSDFGSSCFSPFWLELMIGRMKNAVEKEIPTEKRTRFSTECVHTHTHD